VARGRAQTLAIGPRMRWSFVPLISQCDVVRRHIEAPVRHKVALSTLSA